MADAGYAPSFTLVTAVVPFLPDEESLCCGIVDAMGH
jgi:hypothetical protein